MSSSAQTETRARPTYPAIGLFVLVLAWYVPWSPPLPDGGLDPAWRIGLQVACERGLLFGAEIAFPYGPLGCIANWQYWPATYGYGVLFWLETAGVATVLVLRATTHGPRRLAGWTGLVGLGLMFDTALLVLPFAVVLHALRRPGDHRWSLAGVATMGPLALVKFTALPVCALAVVASGLLRDRPLRTAAGLAAVFGAAYLATWIAAGQEPSLLIAYLADSVELSRGYTGAMSVPPEMHGPAAIIATLIGVLFVLMAVDAARVLPAGHARIRQLAWAAFATFVTVIVWRQGVVRMDRQHILNALVYMASASLLLVAVLRPRPWAVVVIVAGALAGLALGSVDWPGAIVHDVALPRLRNVERSAVALVRLERPARERERALASWRTGLRDPLRGRPGTHDVLGHDQQLLALRDPQDWRPRPTLQGYVSFTPLLAARVAAWIASEDAPRWLTIRPATIDSRWLTQDDAPLWPILRERYAVVDRAANTLVLERRPKPLPGPQGPGRTLEVRVGDWFAVPADFLSGDVHLRITDAEADAGLAGRVFPGLASLYMEVQGVIRGPIRRFRLVPEIAATGFLLSPDVRQADVLEAWLTGGDTADSRVAALRVTDIDGRPVPARFTFSTNPFAYPLNP
jgi:hypothetical protein